LNQHGYFCHCFFGNASFSTETADANGNKETTTTVSKFEEKIEQSSAKMYFHYYGQLLHQQNMMQDYVRTGNGIPSFVCCSSYTYLWMCEKWAAGSEIYECG